MLRVGFPLPGSFRIEPTTPSASVSPILAFPTGYAASVAIQACPFFRTTKPSSRFATPTRSNQAGRCSRISNTSSSRGAMCPRQTMQWSWGRAPASAFDVGCTHPTHSLAIAQQSRRRKHLRNSSAMACSCPRLAGRKRTCATILAQSLPTRAAASLPPRRLRAALSPIGTYRRGATSGSQT
jgi:hypothetical protein